MSKTAVYGGAGCGKTTYLINEVVRVAKETHLRSVCMITLTNNASNEFIERAIKSTGTTAKHLTWFSTMHKMAWRICGLGRDNRCQHKDETRFRKEHGYTDTTRLFNKLRELDGARRNCCCACTNDGFKEAMNHTGVTARYKHDMSGVWGEVASDQMTMFGEAWEAFIGRDDIFDYTRAIEHAVEMVKTGEFVVPFTKLFVDEFQDFSPLQHRLFVELSNAVEDVWVCGDDWQTIYRFAGARPDYLIDGDWDKTVVLPKTYRYGDAILENSMRYIRPLSVKFDRDIEPADHDSGCRHVRYDDWIDIAKKCQGKTVYLTRANNETGVVAAGLRQAGIQFAMLGTKLSNTEEMRAVYNTTVALHEGEPVTPEGVQRLIKHLPQRVKNLPGSKPATTGYLKSGVKKVVKTDEFIDNPPRPMYDADTFGEDFIKSGVWDSRTALVHMPDVERFVHTMDVVFPDPMVSTSSHHVGTVHKFKGNEADNVFLFAQIPYPISDNVKNDGEACDDELRTFYVGATRAKHMLVEIEDYLTDRNGNSLMNVSEIADC